MALQSWVSLLLLVLASVFGQSEPRFDLSDPNYSIPSRPTGVHYENWCVFTIAAWNNFGFVQAFFESVFEQHPGLDCAVWFVADTPDPPKIIGEKLKKQPFKVITVPDLIPYSEFNIYDLAFKFDIVEFSTTIKPLAFLYMFEVFKAKQAIYFDNDIWVTDSLEDIVYLLQDRSVVLTPHTLSPLPENVGEGNRPKDLNIMIAGGMNFGFVSFSNTKRSLIFLNWWYRRLKDYGYCIISKGMHWDQNWGMFVMSFFNTDEYFVIRDYRYNIAYWNLHDTGILGIFFSYLDFTVSFSIFR